MHLVVSQILIKILVSSTNSLVCLILQATQSFSTSEKDHAFFTGKIGIG